MNALASLRRCIHVLATPPAALPDAYTAFRADHDEDPLNWPPAVRAEYQGYAEAFAFLAAADAHRRAGGRW